MHAGHWILGGFGIKFCCKWLIYRVISPYSPTQPVNSTTQSVLRLRLPVSIRLGGLCLAIGAFCTVASGQTWDGSSNSNWSTSANWTPASVPGYGATVDFDDTPGSNQTINVGGTRQIAEVNVNSQYDYTFSGGNIVFATGTRELNYSGSGDLTIDSGVKLNGDTIFSNTSTGQLTLNGTLGTWSNSILTLSGTGATVFNTSVPGGAGLNIEGGANTFNNNINSGDINISGGTNTFNAQFNGGTTLNITGGNTIITDNIGGGSEINVNVTSGGLSIEGNIGGGANIDVESGQLALSGTVGSGAAVVIESGGTLLLEDGADLSGGGSDVTLNGGTLAVSADEVFIANLTLNEDSTIDMLNDADADIDFGNISGSATVNIVNYNSTDQVYFNPSGSSINVSTQVFFDGAPGMIDPEDPNRIIPGATPVPEPETVIAGILLLLVLGGHGWRRYRRQAVLAAAVAV